MTHYRILTIIIGVSIAGLILVLIRKDKIHASYSVWWGVTAVSIAFFGIFPNIIDYIGARLGISYPPILLIIVALCLAYIKILTMDLERSRQEKKIRILLQRLALYESEQQKSSGNTD